MVESPSVVVKLEEGDVTLKVEVHPNTREKPKRMLICVFILMSLLECFLNYDVGAMAIMIQVLQEPYDFSTTDLGLMGSLHYAGLIVSCPFIGIAFSIINGRLLIITGLILNVLSLVLLALAKNKAMFYSSRFFIGATQAIFIIYAPVWVGVFAPAYSKNVWMAILQGSIVIGFMLGYSGTALIKDVFDEGWRWSIVIQTIVVSCLVGFYFFVPSDYINIVDEEELVEEKPRVSSNAESIVPSLEESIGTRPDRKTRCQSMEVQPTTIPDPDIVQAKRKKRSSYLERITSDVSALPGGSMKRLCYGLYRKSSGLSVDEQHEVEENTAGFVNIVKNFCHLIRDPFFFFSTLAISVVFYILTAIQFWTTKVALSLFDISPSTVYMIFVLTSITAPIAGVAIGSWIIDIITRKYPTRPIITDFVILCWSIIAFLCGLAVVIHPGFMNLVLCIWFILFFGGCMLPPLTLISLSKIPDISKPMASGICMCVYHILGYIGGTIGPGFVADITKDDTKSIYATYLPACIGIIGTVGNVVARHREDKRARAAQAAAETEV
ncbi:MFS general substrate transporter like protein [Babesia gibsoni]|uniref:MFS general substrate transporter like protein n=1 Tax=Babesia gibsoni TaxID=33632 RepID=A0AAD8UU28_BABGI|nr:MFS general substrate transporter like protein [Babesia gibsoni]